MDVDLSEPSGSNTVDYCKFMDSRQGCNVLFIQEGYK